MKREQTKDIPVIYEDENLLVINKPAGLSVHADGFNQEETLIDWLLEKYPEIKEVGEAIFSPAGEKIAKPGLVHRLDKDTSGVLVIAKNQKNFLFLKKQFQEHRVKKTYLVIVEGAINFKPDETERKIELPIGRSRKDPRTRVASPKAFGELRPAVTNYRVLTNFGEAFTLVEAKPQTGRTHQLRAHFKAINHPIICDRLYNPKGNCPATLNRQALHAFKLEIELPSGERKIFEAPIPEDMAQTLDNLKRPC